MGASHAWRCYCSFGYLYILCLPMFAWHIWEYRSIYKGRSHVWLHPSMKPGTRVVRRWNVLFQCARQIGVGARNTIFSAREKFWNSSDLAFRAREGSLKNLQSAWKSARRCAKSRRSSNFRWNGRGSWPNFGDGFFSASNETENLQCAWLVIHILV